MRTWKNVNKVQRIFFLFVLTFIVATAILTGYALSFLGADEANVYTAALIKSNGTPLGLLQSCIFSILFLWLIWFVWIQFPLDFERGSKWQLRRRPLNLIGILLSTFLFFLWIFWPWLFDFANDAAQVSLGSKMFFSLPGTGLAIVLALISTAIYLTPKSIMTHRAILNGDQMVLSDEQKIGIITRKKDAICEATNKILESISKLPEPTEIPALARAELNESDTLLVRQEIQKILSELSMIAQFLDSSSKEFVNNISLYASFPGKIRSSNKFILESFCAKVNSLPIDFNKRPWKFSAEGEIGLLNLLKLRAKAEK